MAGAAQSQAACASASGGLKTGLLMFGSAGQTCIECCAWTRPGAKPGPPSGHAPSCGGQLGVVIQGMGQSLLAAPHQPHLQPRALLVVGTVCILPIRPPSQGGPHRAWCAVVALAALWECRPCWLVLGWTSRQSLAQGRADDGGWLAHIAALHTRTGNLCCGHTWQPPDGLSTTCQTGHPGVPVLRSPHWIPPSRTTHSLRWPWAKWHVGGFALIGLRLTWAPITCVWPGWPKDRGRPCGPRAHGVAGLVALQ